MLHVWIKILRPFDVFVKQFGRLTCGEKDSRFFFINAFISTPCLAGTERNAGLLINKQYKILQINSTFTFNVY